jgi:hypothetical protein
MILRDAQTQQHRSLTHHVIWLQALATIQT